VAAPRRFVSRHCALQSTGAMSCFRQQNSECSGGCLFSPVASRWKRQSVLAQPRARQPKTFSISWRAWSTSRWCRLNRAQADSCATVCWKVCGPTRTSSCSPAATRLWRRVVTAPTTRSWLSRRRSTFSGALVHLIGWRGSIASCQISALPWPGACQREASRVWPSSWPGSWVTTGTHAPIERKAAPG